MLTLPQWSNKLSRGLEKMTSTGKKCVLIFALVISSEGADFEPAAWNHLLPATSRTFRSSLPMRRRSSGTQSGSLPRRGRIHTRRCQSLQRDNSATSCDDRQSSSLNLYCLLSFGAFLSRLLYSTMKGANRSLTATLHNCLTVMQSTARGGCLTSGHPLRTHAMFYRHSHSLSFPVIGLWCPVVSLGGPPVLSPSRLISSPPRTQSLVILSQELSTCTLLARSPCLDVASALPIDTPSDYQSVLVLFSLSSCTAPFSTRRVYAFPVFPIK